MLSQTDGIFPIRAIRPESHERTKALRELAATTGIRSGLLTLFCHHSSVSLVFQGNVAPSAERDFERT